MNKLFLLPGGVRSMTSGYDRASADAKKATDEANVQGTSAKAHEAAAVAHRKAADSTQNKEQEAAHIKKAAYHQRLANEYKKGASIKGGSLHKWASARITGGVGADGDTKALIARAKAASKEASNFSGDDAVHLKMQIKARDLCLEAAKRLGNDPMGALFRDDAKGHDRAIAMLKAEIARG